MKHFFILIYIILCATYSSKGQNKGDTTKGLTMHGYTDGSIHFRHDRVTDLEAVVLALERKIDSLERRPYLFIDLKTSRPGVWLTNVAGEYEIFITPINPK